jgi:pimeloyl-ACP methyl ester carboxylesterase
VDTPETRYAKSDGIDIAYQSFGTGDVTVVGVPPIVSNIELVWEDPPSVRFLRRLGSFCRFIHFDKRGTGMSERTIGNPTLEQRVDDLRAVMDAEGVESAVIAGVSEGGSMAAYFAATHPDRTIGLILCATFARLTRTDGYDIGPTDAVFDTTMDAWSHAWGTPDTLTVGLFAPSKVGDAGYLRWLNRFERTTVSPGGLRSMMQLNRELDIRAVLPTISVPTLIIHRTGDLAVPVEHGRFLAEHIPNARYVELPGMDHLPWFGDADAILDEMEEHVTGNRHEVDTDRILSTVLFTDIVGSTAHASTLGDRKWRAVLDDLDDLVDRQLERYRGRLVKSTGDGHLALFDGPARAVRCASELCEAAPSLNLQLRAGLHTGEVELRGDDVGGIGVHIGARVGALAGPSEVLVSRTVTDLVAGSGIEFSDRGEHDLKGVTGRWQLYAVTN